MKLNTQNIKRMPKIGDVADYVILYATSDDAIPISNLKLQKLLYYIQAWSYGIHKQPLFEGEFQAWVHGPVNPDIFNRFKAAGKTLFSGITKADVRNNSPKIDNPTDKFIVDLVLDNYLKYSGVDLERISQGEKPWQDARGTCGSWDRCERAITPESMISYYGEKWEKS